VRKVFAIIAVGCLLLMNAGYIVLYYFRLAEVREEMHKELLSARKTELTTFIFTSEQVAGLDWEEDNEFRYQSEMYDVLQMQTDEGKTTILCLPDRKEKELREAYANNQSPSKKESSSTVILKLLQAPFLLTAMPDVTCFYHEKECFILYHSNLISSSPSVITPPPKEC